MTRKVIVALVDDLGDKTADETLLSALHASGCAAARSGISPWLSHAAASNSEPHFYSARPFACAQYIYAQELKLSTDPCLLWVDYLPICPVSANARAAAGRHRTEPQSRRCGHASRGRGWAPAGAEFRPPRSNR
jgi:hypothetical protein